MDNYNSGFSAKDVDMLGLEHEADVTANDVYIEPETVAMKLRVLSNRGDLESLEAERASNPGKTKCIHLAFRPSSKDILLLTSKLPGLELIQLPRSYRSSFSSAMCMYLDNLGVALLEGDVWGHRKDINEWADVKIIKTKYDEAMSKCKRN